jgi:hypothetical protein
MLILRREQAVWELRKGFNAHTQERAGSMGTEEAFQCPYSGESRQYGN